MTVDTFKYDALGLLISAKNDQATVDFTYDATNRILSETLNGKKTGYAYDVAAGFTTITYPSGKVLQRKLGSRNELIALVKGNNTTLAQFGYDADGKMITKQFKNNTSAALSYNTNGQVSSLAYNPSRFTGFDYSYDKEDNIVSAKFQHKLSGSEQYTYDKTNQLTGFLKANGQQSVFHYDGVGDRTTAQLNGVSTTYTTNNVNAYTSISAGTQQNFVYDANGNLTGDGSKTYGYDEENRMVKVNGGDLATYSYDPFGRRVKKRVGDSTVNYFYGGLQVIEEQNGVDSLNASYTWGVGIDDLVSMTRNGKEYYYHTNLLNSVASVTDSSGSVVERYEYEPFGSTTFLSSNDAELPSSAIGNTYTYTGRQYDPETGLYDYRFRHYNSLYGHFLQKDPLGYLSDGNNLYRYVRNNPIYYRDPLGLLVFLIPPALGIALGTAEVIAALTPLAVGAFWGFTNQKAKDIALNKHSSWEYYVGSVIGGAAGHYITPVGSIVASNLLRQVLLNVSHKQCGFDLGSLGWDVKAGGVTSFVPGLRIPSGTMLYKLSKRFAGMAAGVAISSFGAESGLKPSSEENCPCEKK